MVFWNAITNFITQTIPWFDGILASIIIILIKAFALIIPLMLMVAYFTYAERKVIGYMQLRLGLTEWGQKVGFSQLLML